MSEWKRYKLNEIASLSNGINFDKSAYTSGVKLIGVADFKDRVYPDYGSLQEVDSKVVRNGDYLEKGDIVFVRSNGNKELVGRCMMIDRDIPVTFSGFCIKLHLIDKNKFEPAYFNYLFRTREFKKVMTGTAVGANIQNLSQSRLGNCEINVPNIETQRELAIIISRYDSLIENYQKQIKLLEESAQRLYKEWFIDLHFPGHENTKIVDGVPEGWEKKRLADIAELKTGGDKPDIVSDVRTEDCAIPIFSNGTTNEGLYGFTKVPEIMEHCVTISARGSVGYTVLRRTPFVPIVRLISVIPHNAYVGYIFYYLKSTTLDSNGAAQQQITIPMIRNKEITIPSKGILEIFESQTEPIFNQIDILKDQIRHLTEARDRLLPKLMSGEIEV